MQRNLIQLLLVLTIILQVHTVHITLEEVRSLGSSCPDNLDNCQIPFRSAYKKERTCECDEKCAFFDDCCVDSPFRPEKAKPIPENIKCLQVGHFASVYAVGTCPEDFKNDRIRKLCEENNFYQNRVDGVPVTDPNSEITYLNKYCAVCNGVDLSSTFYWLIGTTAQFIKFDYPNVTAEEIIDNIQSDEYSLSFVKQNPAKKEENTNYYLDVTYFFPSYHSDKVRFCWKNLVADCPIEWKDETFREKCRSYVGTLFFYKLVYDRLQFRNIHCALCNNITFSPGDYKCEQEPTHVKLQTSFLVLMDFNFGDGETVSETKTCKDGVYDVFSKKCRKIVCGLDGYVMVNGNCEPV